VLPYNALKCIYSVAWIGGAVEGTKVAVNRLDWLGFREWARGPAKVIDGEVVLDEHRAERYLLVDAEENERMAFALAALPFTGPSPSPKGVEDFVRRYGLLWHGSDSLGTRQARESLQDWAVASHQLLFVGALYKELTDSRESQTIMSLQELLRQFGRFFPNAEASHDNYRLCAAALLRDLLNSGLWGPSTAKKKTQWGLVMEDSGDLVLGYYAPDLLTTSYAAFAHLMANKHRMKTCAGCGALFRPAGRSDQKWCRKGCGSTTRAQKRRSRADQS
jgi:hypothetical protein